MAGAEVGQPLIVDHLLGAVHSPELGEARVVGLDVLNDSRMGCADIVAAGFGEFVGNTVHDLVIRAA